MTTTTTKEHTVTETPARDDDHTPETADTPRAMAPIDIPDFQARMDQARRRALYEIGDATWAHTIINAFLNPTADFEDLAEERAEDV